jgi:branched-subunit amino acid aminotransferase/4-amino-4-deoxychorismate lyase
MPPLAYLNGAFIAADQAAIRLDDAGFVLGATVTEQLRTFDGRLFRLDEHLARLQRSLEIVEVTLPMPLASLADSAAELVRHNHALLEPGDDLGLAILVTPGAYAAFSAGGDYGPTVCLHTYPLPFQGWAEKYRTGHSLVTTPIEQVSSRCWPAELKCRSRMHYYLAQRYAQRIEPGAQPLLKDQEGQVTETPTANLVIYRRDEGLISPPRERILSGVSRSVLMELAALENIPFRERRIDADDVRNCDEALLTSTPYCILPVTRFEGHSLGSGRPGEVYQRLLQAWSRLVGFDIAAQAERFQAR